MQIDVLKVDRLTLYSRSDSDDSNSNSNSNNGTIMTFVSSFEKALRILGWIIFAARALSVCRFSHAIRSLVR